MLYERIKNKIKRKCYELLGLKFREDYYLDSPFWGSNNRNNTVKKLDIYSDIENINIPTFYNKKEHYIYSFPKRYIYEIENAHLEALNSLVYDYKGKLIGESSSWNFQRLLYEISKPYIKPIKQHLEGTYLFLPTITNYYHWLLEDLPPFLASYTYLKNKGENFKIVIGKDYNFPPIKEFIAKFLHNEEIIILNKLLNVERLIFTSKTAGMGNPFAPANIVHPKDIQTIRDWFDEFLEENTLNKKIYLSRSKARRSFKGEELLDEALKEIGFEIFHGDIGLIEQIKLFSNTSLVVGNHGASMTNIIWMPFDSNIIELHKPNIQVPFFYNVAKERNLKFNYMEIDIDEITNQNVTRIVKKLEKYIK